MFRENKNQIFDLNGLNPYFFFKFFETLIIQAGPNLLIIVSIDSEFYSLHNERVYFQKYSLIQDLIRNGFIGWVLK